MAARLPRAGGQGRHRAPLREPRTARAGDRLMPRSGSQSSSHAAREYLSDRIEERPAPQGFMRWSFVLTCFMRILAILWIMKGLSAWAVILGVWTPIGQFEARSTGYQATIIYFALIDLIAAVG